MAENNGDGDGGGGGPRVRIVRYMECRRNHAVQTAGYVVDGCRVFVKITDAAVENPESAVCATCGCHRSFHRKREFRRRAASNRALRRLADAAAAAGAPLPPLPPRPPRPPRSAQPQQAPPQLVPPHPAPPPLALPQPALPELVPVPPHPAPPGLALPRPAPPRLAVPQQKPVLPHPALPQPIPPQQPIAPERNQPPNGTGSQTHHWTEMDDKNKPPKKRKASMAAGETSLTPSRGV